MPVEFVGLVINYKPKIGAFFGLPFTKPEKGCEAEIPSSAIDYRLSNRRLSNRVIVQPTRAADEGVESLASVSPAHRVSHDGQLHVTDVADDGPLVVCSSRPAMDDSTFSTNSIDYRSDQSSVESSVAPVGFGQTKLASVSFLVCSFLPVQLRFGFASAPLLVLMSSWRVLGANSASAATQIDEVEATGITDGQTADVEATFEVEATLVVTDGEVIFGVEPIDGTDATGLEEMDVTDDQTDEATTTIL